MAPKLVAASNHKDHHMHYALPNYDFTTILIQKYSSRKIFFAKFFFTKNIHSYGSYCDGLGSKFLSKFIVVVFFSFPLFFVNFYIRIVLKS